MPAVSEDARALVDILAERCRPCFQCGRCRGACPQGLDLAGGPRAVVRLILAGDVPSLLASEDVWRCSECGACTEACPMGVDVAGALAGVRRLQRAAGGPRCPERSGAELAARQLRRRRRLGGLRLGLAMAVRGFLPRHRAGAVAAGARAVRGGLARPRPPAVPGAAGSLFYAGCALRADPRALRATEDLAAAAGLRLDEPGEAGCCGHPARDAEARPPRFEERVLTACPACERTLARGGSRTAPVWGALVERARHGGCRLSARSARFVPYVGCLADRDPTLAVMVEAGELAGAEPLLTRPSLHATCCGALGGVYRGPSQGVIELLSFAAARRAPIVTPCLLCRDNVASASRLLRSGVEVRFLPEYFRAEPITAPLLAGAPGAVR
jgi:ferredoxin